jgi:hypothetical protein
MTQRPKSGRKLEHAAGDHPLPHRDDQDGRDESCEGRGKLAKETRSAKMTQFLPFEQARDKSKDSSNRLDHSIRHRCMGIGSMRESISVVHDVVIGATMSCGNVSKNIRKS